MFRSSMSSIEMISMDYSANSKLKALHKSLLSRAVRDDKEADRFEGGSYAAVAYANCAETYRKVAKEVEEILNES